MSSDKTNSCLQACCGCTAFGAIAVILFLIVTIRGCMNHRGRPTGGTEYSFAVSPTDDRIVFSGDGRGGLDLFMLEMDGRIARLTETDLYESDPSFSPDGKSIVHAVGKESEKGDRLAILDIATKQSKLITDDSGNDSQPSFSSDGKFVTYFHQSGYAMSGMTPGWDSAKEPRRVQLDSLNSASMVGPMPTAQSRDGMTRAWTASDGIWVSVGSNPSRRVTGPEAENPTLSPDGKTLAYDDFEPNGPRDLYVVPTAGGKPRQLALEVPCTQPQFSYDGKWIYYLEDGTIWRVRPTGHDHSRAAPVYLFSQSSESG